MNSSEVQLLNRGSISMEYGTANHTNATDGPPRASSTLPVAGKFPDKFSYWKFRFHTSAE